MGNQNNHPGQVGAVQLPSRESVTEHQIIMLLNMINVLSPFILGQRTYSEFVEPAKLDGGAACSASVTFINVCNRLDDLLEDETRWNISSHDDLYAHIAQVQAAQVHFLHEQAEAVRSTRRPSFQLRPTLANDGEKFLAFFGDLNRPGHAVIGIGRTPNEALKDFDLAFDRAAGEQVILAAEAQGIHIDGVAGEAPSEPTTPEPKPKKKKNEVD